MQLGQTLFGTLGGTCCWRAAVELMYALEKGQWPILQESFCELSSDSCSRKVLQSFLVGREPDVLC